MLYYIDGVLQTTNVDLTAGLIIFPAFTRKSTGWNIAN